MTTIAIITAMESELNAVKKLYPFTMSEGYYKVNIRGVTILLKLSGIGKVNGALAAKEMIDLGADLIISTGLAGGIDDKLTQGDVVLSERVCYHDVDCGTDCQLGQIQGLPLYYNVRTDIIKKITSKLRQYLVTGLIVTGDEFVTDVKKLSQIKKNFPEALAVDMESAAIAQVCYLNQLPYLSLRIISDVVGKTFQKEEYESFWKNVPDKASEMMNFVVEGLLS